MATHLIAALSDLHAGSTVAVAPPEPIELDDGGHYLPNKAQKWMWGLWEDAWGEFYGRMLDRYQPDTQTLVLNGDMVDGDHHRTPQIVSPLEGIHFRIAHECLKRGPMQHGFDRVHMIRGTESHVGRGAGMEEGLARALMKQHGFPIVEDPDTGTATSYWRRIDIDGVRIDVRHHGRMGQRAHTKDSYIRWYAQDIWLSHIRDGDEPPDLALRSHFHQYADSGRMHKVRTRVVALPAWQLLTAYTHRITVEELGELGIVVFVVRDGQLLEPEPCLYSPERPTVHVHRSAG